MALSNLVRASARLLALVVGLGQVTHHFVSGVVSPLFVGAVALVVLTTEREFCTMLQGLMCLEACVTL